MHKLPDGRFLAITKNPSWRNSVRHGASVVRWAPTGLFEVIYKPVLTLLAAPFVIAAAFFFWMWVTTILLVSSALGLLCETQPPAPKVTP